MSSKSGVWVDWCPGCGNFGILNAMSRAIDEMGFKPGEIVLVSGIGCSGKTPHFLNACGVHTLHGRSIPFATGIRLANPQLKVLVNGGDGDLLAIGAGHFVALGRRNVNMLVLIHNNGVYGLTKGQASPTLARGLKTKALARPNINNSVNPIILALAAGFTFIARGYAYDTTKLRDLIKAGLSHTGAAVIDVLQPCPTYNDIMTKEWIEARRYYLEDESGWNPVVANVAELESKMSSATRKAREWADRVPLGTFFTDKTTPSFEGRITDMAKTYSDHPPAKQVIEVSGKPTVDVKRLFSKYTV